MSMALFACTKCNGRHPFDELSKDQQLCKECRGGGPLPNAKCTYCRSEFLQEVKKSSKEATICKKCESNVKLYGKPTACEFCNIIAAFIGSKCQRCTNGEKKYGSPMTCDQCKQRCAFDRKDESRKKVMVDGKLLCWLCTLSYKRALAKAKQNAESRSAQNNKSGQGGGGGASGGGSHHRSSSHSSHKHSHSHSNSHKNSDHSSSKKARLDNSKTANGTILPNSGSGSNNNNSESIMSDNNSTDHLVALTQLREQIASLQKQLREKDQQLLAKDKNIGEIIAKQFSAEKEMRIKIQDLQKQHANQVQELQLKLRQMQKQIGSLSKLNKKGNTESPSST